MKSALPWVLVVVLLGVGYILYSANKQNEAELARLGAGQQESEALRKENEGLKTPPAQQQEIAKLRKDNEELLHLRGENQRLKEENKQLTAQLTHARAESTSAQQAQQQANAESQALRTQTEKLKQAHDISQAAQQISACVNNLRIIESAKQQWANDTHKEIGAVPAAADLLPYLPPSGPVVCPAGGIYSINAVGTLATCSVPTHVLR